MIESKDLSISELKKFHKAVREKKDAAINDTIKAEALIVLRMLDEELETRGYNPEKLFKGYNKNI